VPLRTAQAALRHSEPSLTAKVYTDPRLSDVSGALDALPSPPLDGGRDATHERARAVATGTDDRSSVALPVAENGDEPRQTVYIAGHVGMKPIEGPGETSRAVSGRSDKGKGGMTGGDTAGRGVETKGIEPSTSWLQTRGFALVRVATTYLLHTICDRRVRRRCFRVLFRISGFFSDLRPSLCHGRRLFLDGKVSGRSVASGDSTIDSSTNYCSQPAHDSRSIASGPVRQSAAPLPFLGLGGHAYFTGSPLMLNRGRFASVSLPAPKYVAATSSSSGTATITIVPPDLIRSRR
jgi:hypothetical protein